MSGNRRQFTIHLPIRAANPQTAAVIARTIGHTIAAAFRALDTRDITLSSPDEPEVVHRVFCGRALTTGRRCVLRSDHSGDCNPRIAR
ncbi:hypothetical protein [Micromonospora sp. NBC_01796]|uniref:hypothetical protein n=1 Tax=Micromonospora sp. NBC_01796 TaxID=2975987 RepID=UPI002DDB411E|nr:hypothetical protein [Micromonospora sp. NBC_01796]WSA88313.1 hypothetical protein OIE47_12245 [Micromonospora sp. NBC_01796]